MTQLAIRSMLPIWTNNRTSQDKLRHITRFHRTNSILSRCICFPSSLSNQGRADGSARLTNGSMVSNRLTKQRAIDFYRFSDISISHRVVFRRLSSLSVDKNDESSQSQALMSSYLSKDSSELRAIVKSSCDSTPATLKFINDITSLSYPIVLRKRIIWTMSIEYMDKEVITLWETLIERCRNKIMTSDSPVALTFDQLQPYIDEDTIVASILGYARLGDISKVFELSSMLPPGRSMLSLNLAVKACCKSDKIDKVRELLTIWLQTFIKTNKSADPAIVSLTQTFLDEYLSSFTNHGDLLSTWAQVDLPSIEKDGMKKETFETKEVVTAQQLFDRLMSHHKTHVHLPTLNTLREIVMMYNRRHAWMQMQQIIRFIDNLFLKLDAKKPKNEIIGLAARNWESFVSPDAVKYMPELRDDVSEPSIREFLYDLYVNLIRQQCGHSMFDVAIDTINYLKDDGYELNPTVYIYLLEILYGNFTDYIAGDRNRSQQRLLELVNATLDLIYFLMGKFSKDPKYANQLNADSLDEDASLDDESMDSNSKSDLFDGSLASKINSQAKISQEEKWFQSIYKLVTGVTFALCKRHEPELAEKMYQAVQRFEKEFNITVLNPNSSSMPTKLIFGYCWIGNWKKALEIYHEHTERQKLNPDIQPIRQTCYNPITKVLIEKNEIDQLIKFMEEVRVPG